MSTYKWSVEEEHLLRVLRPTNTYQEIANEFERRFDRGLPGFRSARTSEAIRKKCDRDQITPSSCMDYNPQLAQVDDHWKSIREIQEQYKENCEFRTTGVIDPHNVTRKVLMLSDMHWPLANVDMVQKAVADHSDADVLIVGGDLLEGFLFSNFEKYRRIAAIDEYNCAFDFIAQVSKQFPMVILLEGNHDTRAGRALKGHGLGEGADVLRPNLLARIANGERLDRTGMMVEKLDFSNVVYDPQEPWYTRVGKTLFIHPHTRGSAKPGHTVLNWMNKFKDRMDLGEFDSIVCAHTHKIYKGIINSTLCIECGCLTGLLAYAWTPRHLYHGNGQNGYAVIYQDAEGNTDFNMSGPVYLGEVLPPKKPLL